MQFPRLSSFVKGDICICQLDGDSRISQSQAHSSTSTHSLFFLSLFLAALGLRCSAQAFSSCGNQGPLFVAVCSLLIAVASLVAEHGLQSCGLQQLQYAGSAAVARGLSSCGSWALERSSCGAQAQLLRGMWDLPGPGIEPVSPALAGGFLTTTPPGKSNSLPLISAFLL